MSDEITSWHDKNGRIIERGDIVKVFHFIGARRKRYYMYKQCLGTSKVGATTMMTFGHLNFSDEFYHLSPSENWLDGYEILQGIYSDPSDRPKMKKEPQ